MARRSRQALEQAVAASASGAGLARSHYELALFHDNNGREAEAIPHYEAALAHGLDGELRAECLAWLASSLYKTGRPNDALACLGEARELTESRELMKFLAGLERRVRTKIAGA